MPATTVIDYAAGGEKRFDKAVVNSVNAADGFTTMQITMKPGFDWQAEISPKLPGCPKWCPATHFGFLKVKYEDGSEATVHAGESYMIQPGHLPVVEGEEDAVMVEFCQATKKVLDKME
eukprot:PRCOL_00005112-RA